MHKAIEIGSNKTYQYQLRQYILDNNRLLYENQNVISEWEEMFKYVISKDNPLNTDSVIDNMSNEEIRHVIGSNINDDAITVLNKIDNSISSYENKHLVRRIHKALISPYHNVSAIRLRDHILNVNNNKGNQMTNCREQVYLDSKIPHEDTVSIGVIYSNESIDDFHYKISAIELSMNQCIPGNHVKQV
jgi:hypothetical protein